MPRPTMVAAATIFAMLAAACPSDGGGAITPSPTTPNSRAPVVPRGGISVGVLGEPATLDPYSPLASDLTHWLARPIYPSLFRIGLDGSATAELAGRLETSASRALVTLRPTKWSDGSRITARDVVASIRRARPPSGFARIESARAIRNDVVELRGDVADWQTTLATRAPVLPGGRWRPEGPTSGPFRVAGRVPGLRLVYEGVQSFTPRPALRRVEVTFTQSLEMMLGLLERRRLDAAVLPMSVNLDDRLDELELEHTEGPFSETIYLDLEGAAPDPSYRRRLAGAVDVGALQEGFIRDDGRAIAVEGSGASGGPDLHVRFATSTGDELLTLMQRAMQLQFKQEGVTAELATLDPQTFYGTWAVDDPSDVALRRSSLALRGDEDLDVVPLFRVETVMAWLSVLEGPTPTASPDGPFWNLEQWALSDQ